MILVTNGCSHTAGAELEHVYQRRCYHKAWPRILADKIKYDHVNLSDSGASSHRVVRTTIRYVLDNMRNIRDHFFIINWPGAFRTELKYSDSFPQQDQYLFYDDSWLPMVVGNDKQYKENFSSTLYTVYKSWVLSNNNTQAKLEYLHDILLLQNLFTTYGIKFLFWNASNLFIPNDVPEFDGYRALVHKKTFPFFSEPSYCFTELCKNNKQSLSTFSVEGGFASHYDEKAQHWFASYMHSYLAKHSFI